jgi:hypothetical protein
MKKTTIYFFLLSALIFLISSCATQSTEPVPHIPGFLYGLIHGFILLFSFIAGLFTDYEIYAFPNSGGWYDFGYLLGVMFFFGGGGAGSKRHKR